MRQFMRQQMEALSGLRSKLASAEANMISESKSSRAEKICQCHGVVAGVNAHTAKVVPETLFNCVAKWALEGATLGGLGSLNCSIDLVAGSLRYGSAPHGGPGTLFLRSGLASSIARCPATHRIAP
jgi:hypothetical protein